MGQGYSLLTGSQGPLLGYPPRAKSPLVDFNKPSGSFRMPSSTAIDDFMDAAFDMSSYSLSSAGDQVQLHGNTAVEDIELNDCKHLEHHQRSRLSSISSYHHQQHRHQHPPPHQSHQHSTEKRIKTQPNHLRVDIGNQPLSTSHNDHVNDVKAKTQSNNRTVEQHHDGSRKHTVASSKSRQFVKKSDSQAPTATTTAQASHQHHQQPIHRSTAASGNQRTSQLTDNLRSNLERLLQRSLHQQGSSSATNGGKRLQSEDHRHNGHGGRQRAHHGVAVGGHTRRGDEPHRAIERPSYHLRPVADTNDLIDDDIDLQHFTPASQFDHHLTFSHSRLTDDDPDFDNTRLSPLQVPVAMSDTVLRSASVLSSISRQCTITNKPVAMVQPRKVHGVRVLPTLSSSCAVDEDIRKSSRRPATLARSPAIRQARSYKNADQYDKQLSSIKRWKPVEYQLTDRKSNYSLQEDDQYDGNWQCKRSDCSTQSPSKIKEKGLQWSAIGGHETLMVAQKKDAEIAALLHDIRLQGKMTSTKSSQTNYACSREYYGETKGRKTLASDFEHSLGYFP